MNNDPVKAKIIELVPEIMELKFGNIIRHKPPKALGIDYRGRYVHEGRGNRYSNNARLFFRGEGSQTDYSLLVPLDDFENLGRPITLADVLRAIHVGKPYSYFVSIDGRFWIGEHMDYPIEKLDARWNLATDYDNQTQEVKTFIGSLLGL